MVKIRRRRLLCAGAAAGFAAAVGAPVWAQRSHATWAVPFYRPADVAAGLYRHWAPARALAWVDATAQLQSALQALSDATTPAAATPVRQQARTAWLQAVDAWERLATVQFGPLIERRSARQVDFTPTRPALIQRAIERAPDSAQDMERIGTPAKGLPALEWLLWSQPLLLRPGSPACAYAVQVAAELARDALALQAAFKAGAERDWDNDMEAGDAAFAEFINQWVGALERLRWAHMEKPLRENASRGARAASPEGFPRHASGATAASWARQWQALREMAMFTGDAQAPAPAAGQGVVPLETYLRGRGLNPLADAWVQQVERTDTALRKLQPAPGPRVLAAARELAQTKRLAEADVAPALEVGIGFSDADGD